MFLLAAVAQICLVGAKEFASCSFLHFHFLPQIKHIINLGDRNTSIKMIPSIMNYPDIQFTLISLSVCLSIYCTSIKRSCLSLMDHFLLRNQLL